MKIISRPRQAGKTTELIDMAEKRGGYIVCHSIKEAQRIFHTAKEQGKNINLPITYEDLLGERYHGQGIKEFYIDNADYLLQRLTAVPIEAISVNEPTNSKLQGGGDADS